MHFVCVLSLVSFCFVVLLRGFKSLKRSRDLHELEGESLATRTESVLSSSVSFQVTYGREMVEGESDCVSTRYSVAMECEDRCLKRSSSRRLTLTDPEVVIRDEMASLTRQAASLLELSLDWIFDDLRIRDVVGVWKKCLPVPTADGRWGGGALRNLFKLRNDGGDTPMRCRGSGHSALVEKRAWRHRPWAFGQRPVHGIGPYDKDAAEFFCRGRRIVQVTRGIARDAVATRVSRDLCDAALLQVNTSQEYRTSQGAFSLWSNIVLVTFWSGCCF